MKSVVTASTLALCLTLLAPHASANEPLTVYTVNYPLQYFAQRMAGEDAEVVFPAPPDVDPAFWTPSVQTLGAYQGADLILLNGASYAKWVARVSLPRRRLVDTSAAFADAFIRDQVVTTHSHGSGPAHTHAGTASTTWLDLRQALQQAQAIKHALLDARPGASAAIEDNYTALEADLTALHNELQAVAANGGEQALLASHPVYQYFARGYGLQVHSVLWEPDQLPDEGQWQEVSELATAHGARWMLWEGEPLEQSVARLEQLGIGSIVLDPAGNKPENGDFLSVMRGNADALRRALSPEPAPSQRVEG